MKLREALETIIAAADEYAEDKEDLADVTHGAKDDDPYNVKPIREAIDIVRRMFALTY